MVTGFETAGLVLAALPLVVAALEHYAEGAGTAEKWWRYKRELAILIRILEAEQVRFLNTCEELLAGIVSPSAMSVLLDTPGGSPWQDPELERKLRARLRRSFYAYLETVNDMAAVLEIFRKKLELDPAGKPKWGDFGTFKREFKRVKFSLSRGAYEELVKKIRDDNETLASLTGQNLRLEPTRGGRRQCPREFNQIREQAELLYRVLNHHWCCTCQIPHNASLRLEARTDNTAEDSRDEKATGNVRFKIVFSFDADLDNTKWTPWKWKATEIEPLDNEDVVPTPPTSTSTSCALPVRPKKAVKFAVQLDSSSSAIIAQGSSSRYSAAKMHQIKNLCSAIQEVQDEECLGFLVDELRRRHGIYPARREPFSKDLRGAVSLGRRLSGEALSLLQWARLTRKARLQLALTLASSVLQLHKTPWLNEKWSKSDILFFQGNDGRLYEQPYVLKSFSSLPETSKIEAPRTFPIVRNEIAFALGVLLIELCLGRPLEDQRAPEDLDPSGNASPFTDFLTARRLIDEVYDEGGRSLW